MLKKTKSILLIVLFSGFFLYLLQIEIEQIQKEEVGSWQKASQADCAVVLTGGAGRVREGFDLLVNQQVKKLIISGVNPKARLEELLPMWPIYGDFQFEDVILEKRSQTTFGNALQSLPIAEALNCKDILLVTSRLHMYRAYKSFREAYPQEILIYKHAVLGGIEWSSMWDIVLESVKCVFYSIFAY